MGILVRLTFARPAGMMAALPHSISAVVASVIDRAPLETLTSA